MNIKGINSSNIINLYNTNSNKVTQKKDVTKVSDRIEISELGKKLKGYSLDGVSVDNSKRIGELRGKIESGTYNIDAKLTAKSILDSIKGSDI